MERRGDHMNREILAKQHLHYALGHFDTYLQEKEELMKKIEKAKKEYDHKPDERLWQRLKDLIDEKKTIEYLCRYELQVASTLSHQNEILSQCQSLALQLDSATTPYDIKIEKKQPVIKKEKTRSGQLLKKTVADYIVLDLETTGLSYQKDKIIEIGIVKVRQHVIVEQYQQLINPEMPISQMITDLTGITNEMVKDAPTIKAVRKQILAMIEDEVILGHNVVFDIQFLKKACGQLHNDYLDTLQYARQAFDGIVNNQLSTLVKAFHLYQNAHRALADCLATKDLYDLIIDHFGSIENLYKDNFLSHENKLNVYILNHVHVDHQFLNRNCIITGHLQKMSKKTAQEIIRRSGGTIQKSMNKKVDLVIVGKNPYGNKMTAKHQKALQLQSEGQKIDIMNEQEFYRIIDWK